MFVKTPLFDMTDLQISFNTTSLNQKLIFQKIINNSE